MEQTRSYMWKHMTSCSRFISSLKCLNSVYFMIRQTSSLVKRILTKTRQPFAFKKCKNLEENKNLLIQYKRKEDLISNTQLNCVLPMNHINANKWKQRLLKGKKRKSSISGKWKKWKKNLSCLAYASLREFQISSLTWPKESQERLKIGKTLCEWKTKKWAGNKESVGWTNSSLQKIGETTKVNNVTSRKESNTHSLQKLEHES